MASFAAAGRRLSARLAGRSWMRPARGTAGFRTSARCAVAQNFTMPALSPTMTEGNIATWQVKEGDRFSAGDVLLEIETDKASMDVEAQEDGQVFKILQPNGAKNIKVGARIGVLAEAEDDLASLELPPDEPVSASASSSAAAAAAAAAAPEPAAAASTSTSTATNTAAASASSSSSSAPQPPQKYPLFPSVAHLIHEHGLDQDSVVSRAKPTGPGGRLLKGDVLAFLGQIPASVPAGLAARQQALSHLDLSNIRLRAPPPPPPPSPAATAAAAAAEKKAAAPAVPATTLVSLPVSLAAVMDVQEKIQKSLGVFMPVSTFVARATDVANDALPRAGPALAPSAAQLFDEIVGVASSSSSSRSTIASAGLTRGHYRPQVSALSPSSAAKAKAKPRAPVVDVIDILTSSSKAAPAPSSRKQQQPPPAVSTGSNFFVLDVPAAEEKRAKAFLERLKLVLENEPGRLVL